MSDVGVSILLSSTCRRHVGDIAKCRQILADIACRCDTEEAPTYPIYINYYRQVQISPNIRVNNLRRHTHTLAIIEFLCLSSNNNHKITDMSGIPRHVVKCHVVLDTLPTRLFLCLRHDQQRVATCRRHDTECRRLGNKIDTPTSDMWS